MNINHQQAHTERMNINQSTTTSTTKEQQFPLYKQILKTLDDGQLGRNM
jgi:hypothetical protein